jgi:hypothetical protein
MEKEREKGRKNIISSLGFRNKTLYILLFITVCLILLGGIAFGLEFLFIRGYQAVEATYVTADSANDCGYISYVFNGVAYNDVRIESNAANLVGHSIKIFVNPSAPESIWALIDMAIIPGSIAAASIVPFAALLTALIIGAIANPHRILAHHKEFRHEAALLELHNAGHVPTNFRLIAVLDGKEYESQTCHGIVAAVEEAVSRHDTVSLYLDVKGHYYFDIEELNKHLIDEQIDEDLKKVPFVANSASFNEIPAKRIWFNKGASIIMATLLVCLIALSVAFTYTAFSSSRFNYDNFVSGALLMPLLAIISFLYLYYFGFTYWKVENGVLTLKRLFRKPISMPLNTITRITVDSALGSFPSRGTYTSASFILSNGKDEMELNASKESIALVKFLNPEIESSL